MTFDADDMTRRLRAEFPAALRCGQVVGYFQPEVELSTGRLVAAELLARWEHPEYGTLQPALFLPLAEELGLMGELCFMTLGEALAQHRAWAAAGWVVPVSVNVAPDCVADPAFPATVARLLREEQVPGRMLALEVSEETGTTVATTRFFAQLAESGVRVSVDDFGTGVACLESLGGWPVDELKLDMSIVRPMVASARFRAIVGSTIDLAHQLGVRVVAEGIESEAVSSELRALGCDIGQGFFLGRPMPAAAFTEWMRDPARLVPRLEASGYAPFSPAASEDGPRPAAGAAGRAVRAARRAVQPAGGGALGVAAAMVAVYALWQVFRWGGREHQALIGGLAFVPLTGAAILLAWRASRRADLGAHTCRGWRLFSVALCLYLLGHALQLVYEVVLHRRAYPTWADAAYLSFYLVAFWGLVSFPASRRPGPERLRLLLDAGTVFIGGTVLVWYTALGPAVASGARPGLSGFIAYAYPAGDLLLLFGGLTVLWRGVPRSSATALRILAGGMLTFIAADLTYDRITLHSAYLGGDPVDTPRFVAVTILCLAAACQLRTKPAEAFAPLQPPAPTRPSRLPYLASGSSYLLLAVVGLRSVPLDALGGILLGAVALTIVVSARQYIALLDCARLADQYHKMATIDAMTGLYNRWHLMETAEAAFARAQRLGQSFVALMIDVDSFKQINDTQGHSTGDQVLAELAQACREQVRPGDIVGRYGGDEFIIMASGITSRRAAQLAEQLARPAPPALGRDGKPLAYTTSIGIAECLPGSGDVPTLLKHADLAMYETKQAGGGGWRIFGHADQQGRQKPCRPTPLWPRQRPGSRRGQGCPGDGHLA
jgi:diguanylate cyclase (GGDEF)-like protein